MPLSLLGNLERGHLFILSAPAGTGKTTLVQLLLRDFSCVIASISYTTRKPRFNEIDGIHYHFIEREDFLKRIDSGDFLEYVELYGDLYGTSKSWVEDRLSQGKHVILVIDTQGAVFLKGKISATTIFIAPPSLEELERRLRARKTESEKTIEARLLWAKREMGAKNTYDYLIVNEDLSIAYDVLRSILIAEEHRMR